eukprot:361615-Chlamydomonas_euryale.AAC.4
MGVLMQSGRISSMPGLYRLCVDNEEPDRGGGPVRPAFGWLYWKLYSTVWKAFHALLYVNPAVNAEGLEGIVATCSFLRWFLFGDVWTTVFRLDDLWQHRRVGVLGPDERAAPWRACWDQMSELPLGELVGTR